MSKDNYCRSCGKASYLCRNYECKAKARKHQYLKKVGETVSSVPHMILVDVVSSFIKSAHFDIDSRRGLLEELRRLAIKDPEYQVYPNMHLTEYQVKTIRTRNLVDMLPILLEIGKDTGGTVLDIYEKARPVITGVGMNMPPKPTKRDLGVCSALLLLGGYCFKSSRTAEHGSRKILKAVPGTELLTMEARISMAMERCKVMRLIKDNLNNDAVDSLVYSLI